MSLAELEGDRDEGSDRGGLAVHEIGFEGPLVYGVERGAAEDVKALGVVDAEAFDCALRGYDRVHNDLTFEGGISGFERVDRHGAVDDLRVHYAGGDMRKWVGWKSVGG